MLHDHSHRIKRSPRWATHRFRRRVWRMAAGGEPWAAASIPLLQTVLACSSSDVITSAKLQPSRFHLSCSLVLCGEAGVHLHHEDHVWNHVAVNAFVVFSFLLWLITHMLLQVSGGPVVSTATLMHIPPWHIEVACPAQEAERISGLEGLSNPCAPPTMKYNLMEKTRQVSSAGSDVNKSVYFANELKPSTRHSDYSKIK